MSSFTKFLCVLMLILLNLVTYFLAYKQNNELNISLPGIPPTTAISNAITGRAKSADTLRVYISAAMTRNITIISAGTN